MNSLSLPMANTQTGTHPDTSPAAADSKLTKQGNPSKELTDAIASLEEAAAIHDASMLSSNRIVPTDHPCHIQLEKSLKDAAQKLKISPDTVSLRIYQPYVEKIHDAPVRLPDAHVNWITGRVYLNVALIDALEYDAAKVNSILYHELAHLVLMKSIDQDTKDAIEDPLKSRLHNYEIEYLCDQVAAKLSLLMGEDPRNIGTALDIITKYTDDQLKHLTTDKHLPDIPIFSSHPTNLKRIIANQHLSR